MLATRRRKCSTIPNRKIGNYLVYATCLFICAPAFILAVFFPNCRPFPRYDLSFISNKSLVDVRSIVLSSKPLWKSFPTNFGDKLLTMKNWLQKCSSEHVDCQPQVAQFPKRLIKVGSPAEPPRLVYTSSFGSKMPPYCALSYRWGNLGGIITTKRDTEPAFLKEISYEILPRTFQDAIKIAHFLEIPYIWIDALCIVQDDMADWDIEASKMYSVYSGSALTISAAEARDSSGGFLAHDPSQYSYHGVPMQRYFFHMVDTNKETTFVQVHARGSSQHGAPPDLHTRGWVVQETILSHRLVQCIQGELIWRCCQGYETESGVAHGLNTPLHGIVAAPNLAKAPNAMEIWGNWVEHYSSGQFSVPKDRFSAIIGLLEHYKNSTAMSPCLGLWRESFARDLAWRRVGNLEGTHPVANYQPNIPSWSWLSCPAEITYNISQRSYPFKKIELSHVKLISCEVDWEGKPFVSELKSSRLILNGPVTELFVEVPSEGEKFNPSYCLINNEEHNWSKTSITWRATVKFDRNKSMPPQSWICLHLQTVVSYQHDKEVSRMDVFLLLESVLLDDGRRVHRRAGIGTYFENNSLFSAAIQKEIDMI